LFSDSALGLAVSSLAQTVLARDNGTFFRALRNSPRRHARPRAPA